MKTPEQFGGEGEGRKNEEPITTERNVAGRKDGVKISTESPDLKRIKIDEIRDELQDGEVPIKFVGRSDNSGGGENVSTAKPGSRSFWSRVAQYAGLAGLIGIAGTTDVEAAKKIKAGETTGLPVYKMTNNVPVSVPDMVRIDNVPVAKATNAVEVSKSLSYPMSDTESAELEKNLDKNKVTGSGSWASDLVGKIVEAKKMIKDSDDAMSYIKSAYSSFVLEFQKPTKGNIEEKEIKRPGSEPLKYKVRINTADDIKVVALSAEGLMKAFDEVAKAHGIDRVNYSVEREALSDIVLRCMNDLQTAQKREAGGKFKF